MLKPIFGHMLTAQADQGLLCPLTDSLNIIKCITGEEMPGLDFAHAWNESDSVNFTYARRYLFAWRGPYIIGNDED